MADDFTTPGEAPPRKAGTFRRRTEQGSPIVRSLSKTTLRAGTSPELKAAAKDAGIDLAAEAKTRGVKASGKLAAELLGPMPADETYRRPSSMSRWIAGEQSGIDRWKSRNIIKGIAADPGILERLSTKIVHDDSLLDSVVVAARSAAHETMASERGTFFHSLTEWADAGMTPGAMPWCDPRFNFTDKMVEAVALGWLRFLTDHGLTVLASEITVVCDEFCAAGSVDRIVTNSGQIPFGTGTVEIPAGSVVALDIKTSKYRPADWDYATQIYLYADSVEYDTLTDTRTDHPFGPVSLEHGLIAHVDMGRLADGEACWTLVHVDLSVGRRASLAAAEAIAIDKLNAFTRCDTSTTTDAAAPAAPVTDADRMTKLRGRYEALTDSDQTRFVALKIDMNDAAAVEAGLNNVDPMTQPRPVTDEVPPPVNTPAVPKLSATTDEGGYLTDKQSANVHNHYKKLTHSQRRWVAAIASDAQRCGAGVGIKDTPTRRRGFLVAALSEFAGEFVDDTEQSATEATDVMGAALQLVVGDTAWGGATCGTIVATLDVSQSEQFYRVVSLAVAGLLPLYYTDFGRPAYGPLPSD